MNGLSEVGTYSLISIRGAPLPTRGTVRGSTMLGPANSFKSYEWIGTGSGAAAAVTDSVVQNGTYRVNGSDVFGTSITVHVSGGTSGGAPLVVPLVALT
ncbi:MAG: hypothetical protein ACR2KM_08220 [Gemmatimonadaceae bacterium]